MATKGAKKDLSDYTSSKAYTGALVAAASALSVALGDGELTLPEIGAVAGAGALAFLGVHQTHLRAKLRPR
jgi:hypothetical protein